MRRKVLLLILLLTCLVLADGCQQGGPPGLANTKQNHDTFVSDEGRFSMGLPSATAQSTDVPPVPGQSTGGRSFAWRVPQGFFTVAFADWTYDASDAAKLELSANQTISGAVKAGGKLINKEQKDFAGRPGIESRFNISNHVFIYRHILFKNRLYILSARWPENEDGQRQIEVLDSFKVTGPDTGNG